jgi:hypothetical protein
MKLYKSPNGDVYAYETDGSQDYLIPDNFVELTQSEIDARNAQFEIEKQIILAQKQAKADAKQSALTKLAALGLTQDEIKALL